MVIKISEDFTKTPGARYKTDGDFSGEEFREDFLMPCFLKAIENSENLTIDLDGGYGYATSFLEESFGGLARKYSPKQVLDILLFKSEDELSLVDEIKRYIKNANKTKKIGKCSDVS